MPRPFLPVARTTVPLCACLATTTPWSAVGAAVAGPATSRKAAIASRAVHFIDDSFFFGDWATAAAFTVSVEEEPFGMKKSRGRSAAAVSARSAVVRARAGAVVRVRGRGGRGRRRGRVGAAIRAGGGSGARPGRGASAPATVVPIGRRLDDRHGRRRAA